MNSIPLLLSSLTVHYAEQYEELWPRVFKLLARMSFLSAAHSNSHLLFHSASGLLSYPSCCSWLFLFRWRTAFVPMMWLLFSFHAVFLTCYGCVEVWSNFLIWLQSPWLHFLQTYYLVISIFQVINKSTFMKLKIPAEAFLCHLMSTKYGLLLLLHLRYCFHCGWAPLTALQAIFH